jgi:hypothetical protein
MPDRVHMLLSPRRNTPAVQVVGVHQGKERNPFASFWRAETKIRRPSFWAPGCFISAVGRDETAIRQHIRRRENEDQKLEKLSLWHKPATVRWPHKLGPCRPHSAARADDISNPPALFGVCCSG